MTRVVTYVGLLISLVLIWATSSLATGGSPQEAAPYSQAPPAAGQYLRLLEGSILAGSRDGSLRGSEVALLIKLRGVRRSVRDGRMATARRALGELRDALQLDFQRPISPARRRQLELLVDRCMEAMA